MMCKSVKILAATIVAVMGLTAGAFAQSANEIDAERKALEAEKRALEAEKRLLDVEKRVVEVERELSVNNDFTGVERWVTWSANWLIPGFGSGVFMHDATGVYVQVGLVVGGWIFIISDAVGDGGGVGVTTGLLMLTGNFVFNIVRSSTYHKPVSKMSANVFDGFDVTLSPDVNGDFKGYVRYSLEF